MRIWVTGANGLLGGALQQELRDQGIAFAGSTKLQANVLDLASLVRFYNKFGPFSHVINCAAYTNIDLAEVHQEEARRLNVLAPAYLGLLAADVGMKIVHLSTDYVFDGKKNRPYQEIDQPSPQTVYGKAKLEGERRLLAIYPTACIVRTSRLFGLGGQNFVSRMIDQMRQKEEIKITFDQKSRPTYAPDLAKALIHALDWSGIFHLANSEETHLYAFTEAIRNEAATLNIPLLCRSIERTTPVLPSTPRPLYCVLDTQKAEGYLGKSLPSWREGLREYLYREGLKNREVPRRCPEFESGEAVAKAAKLKKFSDAGGSQISRLSDAGKTDSSITSGICAVLKGS